MKCPGSTSGLLPAIDLVDGTRKRDECGRVRPQGQLVWGWGGAPRHRRFRRERRGQQHHTDQDRDTKRGKFLRRELVVGASSVYGKQLTPFITGR